MEWWAGAAGKGRVGSGLAGWGDGRWAGMGLLERTFVQPERAYVCAE